MAIGLTMIFFMFSLIESLWLLYCIKVKFKNLWYISAGMGILFVALIFLNDRIELKDMCLVASVISFLVTLLVADKRPSLKLESTVLVVLMKNCVLLSWETWFIDGTWLSAGAKIHEYLICFLSELALVIVFGFGIRFLFNLEKKIKVVEKIDNICLIGCLDIFVCILMIYKLIQKSYFSGIFAKIIVSFAGISLLMMEINILHKKWLKEKIQDYANAEHELNEMQKNYYLSLLEKETETKKYRHDMNNHIICIKAFLDEKEYDNLNNYIDNLYNQTFSLVNKGYHTGNSIIDALTNYYVENMDKSIEIELKGKIVRGLDIDDIVLSSIYSNMVVNAIEAQKYIPDQKKKYINVTLKEGKKFAQITIRNAMQFEKIDDVDNIETRKIDKENHGFGLENIRKRLDENHGNLDIRAENHEFCIKATLPLVSGEV